VPAFVRKSLLPNLARRMVRSITTHFQPREKLVCASANFAVVMMSFAAIISVQG